MSKPVLKETEDRLEKAPTGIEGFDQLTGGGLPCERTSLILGGPGTGKTVFALQMLVNGARRWGEPGIFVAFEERSRQIVSNAASFGWDLPGLEARQLFFLDARLPSDVVATGGFDLKGLLASLEAKAAQMSQATGGSRLRLVFDSIDVLLSMMADRQVERQELYRLHDWLASQPLTGMLTARSEPEGGEPNAYLQYMADCVVQLQQKVVDQHTWRSLRVIKYRGSGYAEQEFPLVIGKQGIQVLNLGLAGLDFPVSRERVSSGISRLDHMLAGGYLRGTTTLVTGAPGTAKSTLAGAFLEACCQRGEYALYVSFDEGPGELVRNLASVNLQLERFLDQGLLYIYSTKAEARNAAQHMVDILELIAEHRPTCLVVDPLSALNKAGGVSIGAGIAERLIGEVKAQGLTVLVTSLLEGSDPQWEATPLNISTVADTWIHLNYVVADGERNRALTIVKSRGTPHSNQVRELVLSREGLDLTDVFTAGGQVLMGTLRFEREASQRQETERRQEEMERQRQELAMAEAETLASLEALRLRLEGQRAQLARLEQEQSAYQEKQEDQQERIFRLRKGDQTSEELEAADDDGRGEK